ncbi:MAG TPA: NlpC/P60 family protein [Spirochaetia bacterium]|nr:C40 family peptidase [Spirochaetaceae bacterium]HRW25806.1 NlpC/P60 family protein [Spirochaetia bacterium]
MREAAYAEAERYLGMEYEWGGQDFPRGIDCSGLVVNVYHTVTAGTEYSPPFDDATAAMLHELYSVDTDAPARGDLVFMGDGAVSHVAILDRVAPDENGDERAYFIDAYSAAPGGGRVMERSYLADSPIILSYGRLLVIRYGPVR